jgi:hypothetical protein
LRMIQHFHYRMNRAGLGVVRAIYQALDAGMHQRAGAHGARFNGSKQFAVLQTVVTHGSTGLAQSYDLGVGGGIGVSDVAVPSASYDAAVAYYDRAHRNLSTFQSALGAAQGFFHPDFVGAEFVRRDLGTVACSSFL